MIIDNSTNNLGNVVEIIPENYNLQNTTGLNNSENKIRKILWQLLNQLQPVNFRELAGLSDGEPIDKRHYLIISVEQILKVASENKWNLCLINEQTYIFNGAYWQQVDKQEMKTFLGRCALKLGVTEYEAKFFRFRDDLLKQFFSTAFFLKPEKKTKEVLVNLKNGTYVFKYESQELKEFDPADFLRYQLEFDFDINATAPIFNKYLDRVLPDIEIQNILAEYIGYVFISASELKLEKAMILFGSGSNGKSVFFEIINSLLGKSNISNYSLHSLTNDSGYQRAKIADILLNYASEISPNMDSTKFKQLVSCEPIEARLPYGQPFLLTDYAKLIFNTNELPLDQEQTNAFYRRFLIIPFNVTIPEDERDPELAKKIIDTELSGVFNWVLKGLHRLLSQKKFTVSNTVNDMLNNFRKDSDSVLVFLAEENLVTDNLNEMSLKLLYDMFYKSCKESLLKPVSKQKFSKRLKDLGFIISRKRNGNVVNISVKGFE